MDGNEKLYDFQARKQMAALVCCDPSLTVQADAEESDINVIVRRFGITGALPQGLRAPVYADYEEVFDFRTAQEAIFEGQRSFMRLPAEVRAEFDNDPQLFLEYCSDPGNVDDMVKMGLAIPKSSEKFASSEVSSEKISGSEESNEEKSVAK